MWPFARWKWTPTMGDRVYYRDILGLHPGTVLAKMNNRRWLVQPDDCYVELQQFSKRKLYPMPPDESKMLPLPHHTSNKLAEIRKRSLYTIPTAVEDEILLLLQNASEAQVLDLLRSVRETFVGSSRSEEAES